MVATLPREAGLTVVRPKPTRRPSTSADRLPADVAQLVEAIAMMARSDHDSEAGISLHKKGDSGSDET